MSMSKKNTQKDKDMKNSEVGLKLIELLEKEKWKLFEKTLKFQNYKIDVYGIIVPNAKFALIFIKRFLFWNSVGVISTDTKYWYNYPVLTKCDRKCIYPFLVRKFNELKSQEHTMTKEILNFNPADHKNKVVLTNDYGES